MSRVDVAFEIGSIERFAGRLAAAGTQAPRIMADGLNEGGDKVRTVVRRTLRKQMNVLKYNDIVTRTKTVRASPGRLQYRIIGAGKGLPIRDFPVQAAVHAPVTAEPWGVSHTFKRSFMTSKRGLLLVRIGDARKPTHAIYGPSVAKEIVLGQTAAAFQKDAAPTVETMIFKRLARLLG